MKCVMVLLVEDNPADVELVREALAAEQLHHTLNVATDFEQARNHVEKIALGAPCPDVLLIDLNLPKGNGLELLRIFRNQSRSHDVPVIVVSSSNASHDREQASRLGAAHYFRKPSDLDEFLKLGPLVVQVLKTGQPGE